MGNSRKIKGLMENLFGKKRLVIARVSDLVKIGVDKGWLADEFARIDKEVWADLTDSNHMWTKDQILGHFDICPEMMYCAMVNGEVVCTLTAIRTNAEDSLKNKSWLEKTGNGSLETHVPTGDMAFGASLSVSKAKQGIGSRMVLSAILISLIGEGLKSVYLGARLPGYHKFNHALSAEEYVFSKREDGQRVDPEIRFFERKGFEIVEVVPEYMYDPDSCNYGIIMKWDNPLYRICLVFPLLRRLIKRLGIRFSLKLPE